MSIRVETIELFMIDRVYSVEEVAEIKERARAVAARFDPEGASFSGVDLAYVLGNPARAEDFLQARLKNHARYG